MIRERGRVDAARREASRTLYIRGASTPPRGEAANSIIVDEVIE
jgi:hypothetical protein